MRCLHGVTGRPRRRERRLIASPRLHSLPSSCSAKKTLQTGSEPRTCSGGPGVDMPGHAAAGDCPERDQDVDQSVFGSTGDEAGPRSPRGRSARSLLKQTSIDRPWPDEDGYSRDARCERSDVLADSFGPRRFCQDGYGPVEASPTKPSLQRLQAKLRDLLVPARQRIWPQARDQTTRLSCSRGVYCSCGRSLPISGDRQPGPGAGLRQLGVDLTGVPAQATHHFAAESGVRRARGVAVPARPSRRPRHGPCREAGRRAGCGKSERPVR